MRRILFVCTGNTCRSPMAEALCKQIGAEKGLRLEVKSAGIVAVDGIEPAGQAVEVLKEKGIEYEGAAQVIQEELLVWADLVLTMTQTHKESLALRFPGSLDKVFTLKEYSNQDSEYNTLLEKLNQLYAKMECKKVELMHDPSLQDILASLQKEEQKLKERLYKQTPQYDIQDPYGGTVADYQVCAGELERELEKIVQQWLAERREER